jgi:hypothetical protein
MYMHMHMDTRTAASRPVTAHAPRHATRGRLFLSLQAIGSADRLAAQLSLQLGSTALHCYSPAAEEAARQLRAGWQQLTLFLGLPVAGTRRKDAWLQPQSQQAVFPMRPLDVVWRAADVRRDGREVRPLITASCH